MVGYKTIPNCDNLKSQDTHKYHSWTHLLNQYSHGQICDCLYQFQCKHPLFKLVTFESVNGLFITSNQLICEQYNE